jgi:hypothetical protein
MRAERAAALTNFVLILLFAAGLMMASSPSIGLGFLLRFSAIAALLVHRRITS